MMEDKIYKTSDMGLAAFLCTQGFVFLGPVRIAGDAMGRLDFCLIDREDRDDAVNNYITGQAKVSAKHYYSKLRLVKRSLSNPVEDTRELPK